MNNIKTRIVKLEKSAQTGGFCNCKGSIMRTETYYADLTADAETHEPQLMGEIVPDVCVECRRPIEKHQITVQLCDHTTKELFPEEWNARVK